MTDHQRRIRDYMALETEALLVEAKRARLFDHGGNRGRGAEHGILRWLGARFAPDFSVSSGEIVDSFDTNIKLASRQQDGILHRNSLNANRFLLPSGLRLLPIETVAAVIEVKLTLSKQEFESAAAAAKETKRLRYRIPYRGAHQPGFGPPYKPFTEAASEEGVPVDDDMLSDWRPMFVVFAFGGVKQIKTIAEWMKAAGTIDLVCCLDIGCAFRSGTGSAVTSKDGALTQFVQCLGGAVGRHDHLMAALKLDFSGYARVDVARYWDETGFEHPTWYQPTDSEQVARGRVQRRKRKP